MINLWAVMLYVVQRSDVDSFGPAWDIDPDYSQKLSEAVEKGVEVIVVQVKVSPEEIRIVREIPYDAK